MKKKKRVRVCVVVKKGYIKYDDDSYIGVDEHIDQLLMIRAE